MHFTVIPLNVTPIPAEPHDLLLSKVPLLVAPKSNPDICSVATIKNGAIE